MRAHLTDYGLDSSVRPIAGTDASPQGSRRLAQANPTLASGEAATLGQWQRCNEAERPTYVTYRGLTTGAWTLQVCGRRRIGSLARNRGVRRGGVWKGGAVKCCAAGGGGGRDRVPHTTGLDQWHMLTPRLHACCVHIHPFTGAPCYGLSMPHGLSAPSGKSPSFCVHCHPPLPPQVRGRDNAGNTGNPSPPWTFWVDERVALPPDGNYVPDVSLGRTDALYAARGRKGATGGGRGAPSG